MTIVDHASVHDLTLQGNQAARARAIWHLCENHNLPTVSTWMVDAFTTSLTGLVLAEPGQDPAEQRRKVRAWADFLKVDTEEFTIFDVTTVSAEGPCEYGVRVRISTQLRAAVQEVAA